jgi:hypothetical protein
MDHVGLLTFMRKMQGSVSTALDVHKERRHVWTISPGVAIMPETLCPWCNTVLKSDGIWLFSGGAPRYAMLDGMIRIRAGKIRMEYPGHPNLMVTSGRGALCLGTYQTGMALLSGPANLNDCPMGWQNLPQWYRRYWNHPLCRKGYHWFQDKTSFMDVPPSEYEHLTPEERRHP